MHEGANESCNHALSDVFQEVGLAGMLSLLTAVLLHTTASGSPASSEPDYSALPHNFCTVAEAVLRSDLHPFGQQRCPATLICISKQHGWHIAAA